MAAVPQRTLNWLWSVLTKDHHDTGQTYQDPNRTYHDVANALAQYPSLSPRTDVYTYESGVSALLLHIVGTIPVSFRGAVYQIPIGIWIPNTYPREPPIAYVTPTQDMVVRVGQHVTLEGRVYHHYLAHWTDAWDRSSLADFLSILREVFAKEPPVKYKQQQQQPPLQGTQRPEQAQVPPPLPPLPPNFGSQSSPGTGPSLPGPLTTAAASQPPRLPPKPGQVQPSEQQRLASQGRYDSPPPLPPLPPKGQDSTRQPSLQGPTVANRMSWAAPERPRSIGPVMTAYQLGQYPQHVPSPVSAHPPPPGQHAGHGASPVSPIHSPGPASMSFVPQPPPGPQAPVGSHVLPPHRPVSQQLPYQPQGPPYYQPAQPVVQPHHHRQPAPAAPPPKKDTPDLLTSPFEVELPSIAPTGPAPPIPPNPEKDALLHAVARTVAETIQSNVAQSKSAAQLLTAQSQSLHAAIATLQGEIASLNTLHATLQSNTTVLQQSLHRADGVIADAQTRISSPGPTPPTNSRGAGPGPGHSSAPGHGLPPIDEVLVAPTVVGKQLYDLVAEERGIQHAIYALQAALVKGVLGVETWSRHTRGLAREAFLKRALIRKIGEGMGLEEC